MPRPKYINSFRAIQEALARAGRPCTDNATRKAVKRLDQMAGVR